MPFLKKSIGVAILLLLPYMFFDVTIPEMLGCEESASFVTLLWSMFLEFNDWRDVSVIAVIFWVFCILMIGAGRAVFLCKKKSLN